MNPPSIEQLLRFMLSSFEQKGEIFDIPEKLFYKHWHYHTLYTEKHGHKIHNPIGISSGPLTQLAQNIVTAWLCGARIIELKTVQPNTVDNRIKPSIDIFNGAYNCERSQELSVEQAYDQYLTAWILIHILQHKLSLETYKRLDIGTIFTMSLGYTLSDIRSDKMQWFVDKMTDCSQEKAEKISAIKSIYPDVVTLNIPDTISNSFIVNTWKGCSARELEYICKFLVIDKKLHPSIKFSPKLLGFKSVMAILSAEHTFEAEIKEEDFEDNIQYGEAISLIEDVTKISKEMDLEMTVKISNSLSCKNNTSQIPRSADEVFMSGRALHPIAVNLAAKLQSKFDGLLDISFSGGASASNIVNLIQSGFQTITVCTDLLKPGGPGRLHQYFNTLSKTFANYQAKNIREFILKSGNAYSVSESALENLRNYAIRTLSDPEYQTNELSGLSIKSTRPLHHYDCIKAPCTEASPLNIDTSSYCWFTNKNDANKAINAILADNPMPSVLGMIGDDPSRVNCVRNNYDYPVLMKEVEGFIAEYEPEENTGLPALPENGMNVAVIGGGISGLSCAWYLSRYGFAVDIYEAEEQPGGMVNTIVPSFRITNDALQKDIKRIKNAGIKILANTTIDKERFERIRKSYNYVYVSSGASASEKPDLDTKNAENVYDAIQFLKAVKKNPDFAPGNNIAVIGSNWLAADVARAAIRLVGEDGYVALITPEQEKDLQINLPTLKALQDEEIEIFEKCRAKSFNITGNAVESIETIAVEKIADKRSKKPKYKDVEDSEQVFKFDAVVSCADLVANTKFLDKKNLKLKGKTKETAMEHVFAGGLLTNPLSSIMTVIADAKDAAMQISDKAGVAIPERLFRQEKDVDIEQLKIKKTQVDKPNFPEQTPPEKRTGFEPVVSTLKPIRALKEAARCLHCDTLCNICTEVCPNQAMIGFEVDLNDITIPTITMDEEEFYVSEHDKLDVKQKHQVLVVNDWCNDCGNCTTFCPAAGSPNKDKLRVHFNRDRFNSDTNGLLVIRNDKYHALTLKKDSNLSMLTENWDAFIFENDDCMAVIDKESFKIQQVSVFNDDENTFRLESLAEMKMLLKVVKTLV